MIGIEVKGLIELIRKYNRAPDELKAGFSEAIHDVANVAFDKAVELCPEDNRDLVKSIYLNVEDMSFELGATAKHAVFNEYGCYNLNCGTPESPEPAKYKGFRPFIRPAIIFAKRQFPDIISAKFERVMHG